MTFWGELIESAKASLKHKKQQPQNKPITANPPPPRPATANPPKQDWRPPVVLLATWQRDCAYCCKPIIELRHRICPTDRYGWTHYTCAGELDGPDDYPKPAAADRVGPVDTYQCHGWMPRKKIRCPKTTVYPLVDEDGNILDYYCTPHLKQRPDDAPKILEPPLRLREWDIVGESFMQGYPQTAHRLGDILAATDGQAEAVPAVLIRNPDNEHDANAVEVHVPLLGQQVGHLSRGDAEWMAPDLDSGQVWQTWVVGVLYAPDGSTDNPGIRVAGRPMPQERVT